MSLRERALRGDYHRVRGRGPAGGDGICWAPRDGLELDGLDFLDEGATYRAVIYEDGPNADYERNPYEMTIRQINVNKGDTLHLRLARSGGAAIRIEKK